MSTMKKLELLKKSLMPKNYEMLLNRTYSDRAASTVIVEVDTLLKDKCYVGRDVLDERYGKWDGLASEMRAHGHSETVYSKSFGRKVDVELTPEKDNKEMLQVCAKWNAVPVEKDLRISVREVAAGPCKSFDISTVDQRLSEATVNSLIISTFRYSW